MYMLEFKIIFLGSQSCVSVVHYTPQSIRNEGRENKLGKFSLFVCVRERETFKYRLLLIRLVYEGKEAMLKSSEA